MSTFSSLDELRDGAGSHLGTAGPIRLTQERIDGFAAVTDDHQWIHVDPVRAADGPFGATIAHGYLTLALAAPFLEQLLRVQGVSAALNYGIESARFPAPVPSGSEVSASGELVAVTDKPGGAEARVVLTMTIPGGSKPVCVATIIIRYLD